MIDARARRRAGRARHERAHLRRQHRLRPVRLAVDPGGADRGAPAAAAAQPRVRRRRARTRTRSSAPRCCCARTRSRRATRARGRRPSSCCSSASNRGVLPVVPSRGSVGASGDLAPLAHLALPLVGEGEAWFDGERLPGGDALARVGLEPQRLQAKEGLSLVNGTQFMAAMAALGLVRARRLAKAADIACALSLEALQGSRTSFIPQIHALRPLRGQQRLGRERAHAARGLGDHRVAPLVRQGAGRLLASLRARRCTAQPATSSTTSTTRSRSSSTPRPTTRSSSSSEDLLVSNGNFHGQPLAFALDALAMAVAELANISERRVERLVNPNLSDGLPPFLTVDGGLNSGFHDPAVRGRVARQREQGARPSGERRLDPDERRAGGSRLDGQRRGAEGVAGARERRAGAGDRAARRRAGGRVPRAARARPRRARGARGSSGRSRRACARTGRSRRDIERVAAAIRDGSLVAAVEAEVGSLR